jgi:hypothetical protein
MGAAGQRCDLISRRVFIILNKYKRMQLVVVQCSMWGYAPRRKIFSSDRLLEWAKFPLLGCLNVEY